MALPSGSRESTRQAHALRALRADLRREQRAVRPSGRDGTEVMSTLLALAERIENTPFAVALAESRYAFPVVEGVHLIGLALSVGLIFLTDLRLVGVLFKDVPVPDVLRQLRP